jgi:two-component system, NtrC family, response regulator AtoC
MSLNVEEKTASLAIVTIPSEALPFVSGVSLPMRALERVIADVAPTDVPILVVGESGTGKEVVALEVHRRSKNSNGPFVKCNCSGLSSDSLRIHLSDSLKNGGEPEVRTGTIFFDDISRLDIANQNVLLQFLSDNGSAPQTHSLRPRVIASTTCNLEEEMRAGRFREELYYQINGVCLRLPSLRQRQQDVPLLLNYFVKKYVSSFERPELQLSCGAMEFLKCHSWPGNIRELENFARRLVILGDERLALSDLVVSTAQNTLDHRASALNKHPNATRSLKAAAREAARRVERQLILDSLERTHWNRKRTARELQISYKALLYKLKQFDVDGAADLAQESTQATPWAPSDL